MFSSQTIFLIVTVTLVIVRVCFKCSKTRKMDFEITKFEMEFGEMTSLGIEMG
jgi:hypothetical protein